MPSGKVHYKLWKRYSFLAIAAALVTGFLTEDVVIGIFVLVGYFVGRWFDPDLDQISITAAEGRLMREIPLIGSLIVAYFVPYAYIMRIFGGHRSFMTHFPGFSTAVRILWAMIPWMALAWYFQKPIPFEILIGIFIGLTIADLIHWLADGLPM